MTESGDRYNICHCASKSLGRSKESLATEEGEKVFGEKRKIKTSR